MRDGINGGSLGGRKTRVRGLVPRGLLFMVDRSEPCVGVSLLLRKQLFRLEELRERLERRRPVELWRTVSVRHVERIRISEHPVTKGDRGRSREVRRLDLNSPCLVPGVLEH